MKKLCYLFFFLLALQSTAQVKLDSLWKVWKDAAQPDSNRMGAMHRICMQGYLYSHPDSAFYFSKPLYEMALKNGSIKYQSAALNIQGAASSLRGDNKRAIEYFTQSLRLIEKTNDKRGVSNTLNNIGVIYDELGDYAKAKEYYEKALVIIEAQGNKNGMILSYCNLGNIYRSTKDYSKSIEYLERSLKISTAIGDSVGTGVALHCEGVTYYDSGDYDRALELNSKSIPYYRSAGDKQGLTEVLNIMGEAYYKKGDIEKAIEYNKKSLALAKEAGLSASIREASQALYDAYKKTGKFKEALEMHELYVTMKDSVKNDESQKAMLTQELTYTYDKQKAIDEKEHEKELAVAAEKEQKQKVISTAVAVLLILVAVFAFFVFKRLQLTRKQKHIIEHQKDLVEEKQKEILASITYAKRLQDAILPPESHITEILPDSFVLFKPKDIVAGDFYWMEVLKDGTVLLAAADCTGHGVPGAMVSVVCSDALNRAVFEFGFTEPGKILDKARELVMDTFSKSETDVKDGMDISLASINLRTLEVMWAGANNPLWYISDGMLKEITADKQPIGSAINSKPFTTHKVGLQKGDMLFLFTDGYADQFGGNKGKKFKYKPLKEMLYKNASVPFSQQKEMLDKVFEEWKGPLEQVDDMCIIGVRL